ncbi:MAG: PDZ domain-containing protein, partial [Planctomycetota bacterium]
MSLHSARVVPLLLCTLFSLTACATDLPRESPPLLDWEEPLALFEEPDDEVAREGLPFGSFTGAHVADARGTLDDLLGGGPSGIEVARIIENSPADAAGLRVGDLLLEVGTSGARRALTYPSDWRAAELAAVPGEPLDVVFDRANRRGRATVVPVPRLRAPDRQPAERFREDKHVGVVVRTATEVEARAVGLAPGGGAVIVGLSRRSPWRQAGLQFGDLLTSVSGEDLAHPEVLIGAIAKAAAAGESLDVGFVRDGEHQSVLAQVSERSHSLREVTIPPLIRYTAERGRAETSILLGLIRHERTRAAWELRLLWLIRFGGGDADQLLE